MTLSGFAKPTVSIPSGRVKTHRARPQPTAASVGVTCPMRSHIMRWLKTPHEKALEHEVEGLTIRLRHTESALRALYDLLDEYRDTGTLVLPPRRLWP